MASMDKEGESLIKKDKDDVTEVQITSDHSQVEGATAYLAVGILCLVNLLNYVDRYTVAGKIIGFILCDIQYLYHTFRVKNSVGRSRFPTRGSWF